MRLSQNGRVNDLERLQGELQQLEREIVEQRHLRRADGLERVRDAVRGLGEIGSPTGILDRAAAEIGAATDFDQILISEVRDCAFVPRALWQREAEPATVERTLSELRAAPIALEYPLVEREVTRSRLPEMVDVPGFRSRSPSRLRDRLAWRAYVVSAIVVERESVGLVHADPGERPVEPLDLELVGVACDGLGEVFDRALLRETLQRHRAELQSAVQWIGGRLGSLAADGHLVAATSAAQGDETVAPLTTRELEVLGLMARGQTNAAIAKALVVQEGTVKYHVRNVLRKLGARSRADAVARYVRATKR